MDADVSKVICLKEVLGVSCGFEKSMFFRELFSWLIIASQLAWLGYNV